MARRKQSGKATDDKTADYRYTNEKRTNNPPAKIAGEGTVPLVPKARYAYSPHLSPTLRFDPTGKADEIAQLMEAAGNRALKPEEISRLRAFTLVSEPSLEWTAKREQHERGFLEVDPVALHIHERVSARAILRAAMRENVQRDLFADPQQPYQEAVQFYRHDVDWANRLILGDSLQVMSSLARRENLAGKIQMIYMDPPYGVQFRSNFQPLTGSRSVGSADEDVPREPETVRAYRDTWHHGIHSYLTYLRDRFLTARELLSNSGSLFVQISDDNVHVVRQVLDEVFTAKAFMGQIAFTKGPGGLETKESLAARFDYLLWYCKSPAHVKTYKLYESDEVDPNKFNWFETPEGWVGRLSQVDPEMLPPGSRFLADESLTKPGPGAKYELSYQGRSFNSGRRWWGSPKEALLRALRAERAFVVGNTIRRKKYLDESPPKLLDNLWSGLSGAHDPVYVVQTNTEVVKRCLLLTTDPGDLVLDPTCGSGTTALVAEQFGRRWITVDASRVALFLSRQRLLTATFELYKIKNCGENRDLNPSSGFEYRQTHNVTFGSVSQNQNLDPILDKYDGQLNKLLSVCSRSLTKVTPKLRKTLLQKAEERDRSVNALSEIERRRWVLPDSNVFEHWTIPFDTDPDWPNELRQAVANYRSVWREKVEAVNKLISANLIAIDLRDTPVVVKGTMRVSGPFTVEGVRPEELNLSLESPSDGASSELDGETDSSEIVRQHNLQAYLARMVQCIREDGLTFLGNQHRRFARVEPLFENSTGTILHAEANWEDSAGESNVAIGFGPQYGPVTAQQVEELVHASKRYDELVVAGFSFDAAATAIIQEQSNPRLRIHQAYIRPDINPGMEGLLKQTPSSQLFSVFGTPEIAVDLDGEGWRVTLAGVDIYDPIANSVRSTGAEKVTAWFLDSDFDGRCFCITQAFFPNQDAWDKIAKSLGSSGDPDAFEAFKGTKSLSFPTGKYKRIAVKVIDPRGNEVMAVRSLEG